jgi:glycosyltransferase involved in cell wall biosynthesis
MDIARPNPPIVSIGLPVYNGAKFVRQAFDSILAQTFGDFELVVSDNASTDGTYAICEEYAAKDARIRLYRNERNMGATYNYNRVFELARGKYFRHAAHDDLLAPTNIERCVEVLEANPNVMLSYPRMQRIDEQGNMIDSFQDSLDIRDPDPVRRWIRFHQLCNDGSMCDPVFGLFRSSMLAKTPVLGNFISADMVLLAETALHGEIHEVPEFLFFERWHAGTSVNANPTLEERAAWFSPENRGKLINYLPQWIWLREYLRAVERSPLRLSQKAACSAVMLPWMARNKRGLVLGLVTVGALVLRLPRLAARFATQYH